MISRKATCQKKPQTSITDRVEPEGYADLRFRRSSTPKPASRQPFQRIEYIVIQLNEICCQHFAREIYSNDLRPHDVLKNLLADLSPYANDRRLTDLKITIERIEKKTAEAPIGRFIAAAVEINF